MNTGGLSPPGSFTLFAVVVLVAILLVLLIAVLLVLLILLVVVAVLLVLVIAVLLVLLIAILVLLVLLVLVALILVLLILVLLIVAVLFLHDKSPSTGQIGTGRNAGTQDYLGTKGKMTASKRFLRALKFGSSAASCRQALRNSCTEMGTKIQFALREVSVFILGNACAEAVHVRAKTGRP